MGLLQLVCPAHSGSRDDVHPRPKITFTLLVSCQLVIGVSLFVVGLSAFSYTPSYRVGSFWSGFILFMTGCCKLAEAWGEKRLNQKWNSATIHILFALQILAISANFAAMVADILGGYLLQNTDFSRCSYTSSPTIVYCNATSCPTLTVPSNTCYCCYLYDNRAYGGCETALLTAKQTYFISVSSCPLVPGILLPMLYTLGCLEVLGTVVSIALFCQGQKHDDRATAPKRKIPTSTVPEDHTGTVPEAELTGAECEEVNLLENSNSCTVPEAELTGKYKEVNGLETGSKSYLKQEAHKEEVLKIETQCRSNTEIHITIDNRNGTTADGERNIPSEVGVVVADGRQTTSNGEERTIPDEGTNHT